MRYLSLLWVSGYKKSDRIATESKEVEEKGKVPEGENGIDSIPMYILRMLIKLVITSLDEQM